MKKQKPEVLKLIAQTVALAARDPELLEVLSLYQGAVEGERKAAAEEAERVLSE